MEKLVSLAGVMAVIGTLAIFFVFFAVLGDCTPMQRFPAFTTDFGPHFGQHQAGSITVIFRRRLHWLSKVVFEKGQVGGQSGSVGEVNRIGLDGDIDHPLRFSQHVSQALTYTGQRRNQGPFVRLAA